MFFPGLSNQRTLLTIRHFRPIIITFRYIRLLSLCRLLLVFYFFYLIFIFLCSQIVIAHAIFQDIAYDFLLLADCLFNRCKDKACFEINATHIQPTMQQLALFAYLLQSCCMPCMLIFTEFYADMRLFGLNLLKDTKH